MDLKRKPRSFGRFYHKLTNRITQKTARKLLREAGYAAIGFLLGATLIFGEYAPFGLGYVGVTGAAGIIGTMLGSLCVLYRANGLKYLAISALICTARYALGGSKLSAKLWFQPVVSAACTAVLSFVFLLDDGIEFGESVFFLTEILAVFGSTFLYQAFFNKERSAARTSLTRLQRQLLGLCLCVTLIMPFVRLQLFDVVSVGRMAALCVVMLACFYGGTGAGVICAILQGIGVGAMNLTAMYCAVYGMSAIVGGTLKKWGRFAFLSGFIGVSLGAMFLTQNRSGIALGLESLGAAVLFVPIRMRFGKTLHTLLGEQESGNIPLHSVTRGYLRSAARAFSDLGEMLRRTFSSEQNDQNIVSVFERPARQVCKQCVLCNHCWEQDYLETRNALNDATQAMLQNGKLKVTDLPFHFSTRCLHVGEFVEQVNRELCVYQARRQYQTRLRENRDQMCRQYRDVSEMLESMAEAETPVLDVPAQKRLQRILREAGISADVCVFRDANKRLHLLMEGPQPENEEIAEEFFAQMGVKPGKIERVRSTKGYCIRMSERETLYASLGVACRRKNGNTVCGDTVGHCKLPSGMLCILLADGMGTGSAAAEESGLAVELLIRFLESGISPQSALATVHSALKLKGEESASFTTLDLLCVDLFSGESTLYKFGSAPSYFRRKEETKCVTCTSMPLGISCAGAPSVEKITSRLCAGDDVILMSDGVSDQAVPAWLMQTLKEKNALSPQAFAKEILRRSEAEAQDSDDRTVLVLRLQQE